MSHTLLRDASMLQGMWNWIDRPSVDNIITRDDLKTWDLSWPILYLWYGGWITVEGITDASWQEMESFYEWLISQGMEPVL